MAKDMIEALADYLLGQKKETKQKLNALESEMSHYLDELETIVQHMDGKELVDELKPIESALTHLQNIAVYKQELRGKLDTLDSALGKIGKLRK